jgi:hypothetical protein
MRSVGAGLLVSVCVSCQLPPLDFIGNGSDEPMPEPGDAAKGDAPGPAADGARPDGTGASDAGATGDARTAGDTGATSDAASCDTTKLASDRLNCGACGHSCLGGTCDSNTCQPVMLATGLSGVQHLALDIDNIYVTRWNGATETNGSIVQIPKNLGLSNILTEYQVNPDGIAVDDTYVYWANFGPSAGGAGSVQKVVKSGGTATVIANNQSSNGHGSFVVTVDSINVYWGNYFQVMSCPLGGCADPDAGGAQLATASGVNAIGASGGVVYWTEGDGMRVSMILSTNAGGSSTPLASNQARPLGLALDTGNALVYWTDSMAGTVMRAPLGGGGSPAIAASSPAGVDGSADNISAIAFDATYLYWLDSTAQSIMRAPIGGGTGTPITNYGGADCRDLAVDDTAIYWSCYFSGYVAKLAK